MSTKSEILPLTGLRFVAALYVFLFHIEINWPYAPAGIVGKVIAQGAVGMSVFFVLSGFLLAYQYSGRFEDKKTYFVRRIARIYPIYIVAALCTIPWAPKLPALDMTVLVITDIFVLQAWVPSYFKYWNNGGSWSISVEVFCYAVLPFIVPWVSKLSNKRLACFSVILYILTVVPGQAASIFPSVSFSFFYALPLFRLPEFLLGVCGFLVMQRGFRFSRPTLLFIFILIAFVVCIRVRQAGPPYIDYNWMVVPVVACLVMSLCQSNWFLPWLLSSKPFVWLGKISYCFYSFQALVLLTLITYHTELIRVFPVLGINWVLCVVAFVVLLFLSVIGHHLIEEPCRKIIQNWADSARGERIKNERVHSA